jgi:uncharacterized phage protein (TIGR01671 family)
MRPIKFRGKQIDTGEWVYGYYVVEDGDAFIATDNGDEDSHILEFVKVIPETVGQYTGLDNRNGIEIYEGDVVSDFRCMKFEVIFKDSAFCLKQLNCNYYEIIAKYGTLFVIGNIHDNPELLEAES